MTTTPPTYGTGPRPASWCRQQLGQVSLRLLHIVSRPGGATGPECAREMGRLCNSAPRILSQLYDRGHVTRRMDGRQWRYFIGREAAEAWVRGEAGPAPAVVAPEPERESFRAQWLRLRGEGSAA